MNTRTPKFTPDDLVRLRTHPEIRLVVLDPDYLKNSDEIQVRCVTYDPSTGVCYKTIPECLLARDTSELYGSEPDVIHVSGELDSENSRLAGILRRHRLNCTTHAKD